MKKLRKLSALLIAAVMIFAMAVPAAAASATDPATVKITGLQDGDTVKLYQIADGDYAGTSYQGMVWRGYAKVNKDSENAAVAFADPMKPTSGEIQAIAKEVQKAANAENMVDESEVTGNTYEYETEGAGQFIAIITAGEGTEIIYNPILLTATYADKDGKYVLSQDQDIAATDTYMAGETALAKSSTPTFEKNQEVISVKDAKYVYNEKTKEYDLATNVDGIDTVGIGSLITYTLTPTIPQYSESSNYKVLWFSDKMDDGITYDHSSLRITVGDKTYAADANGVFKIDENTNLAKATKEGNGFKISFNYEALRPGKGELAVSPVIKYNGVINENAVVGHEGNWNDAHFKFTNNPNQDGKEWNENSNEPTGNDIIEKKDKKVVYTFDFVIRKTDNDTTPNPITNNSAKFGVFKTEAAAKARDISSADFVEILTTNANGYATSSLYKATTDTLKYYLIELEAPTGYSRSDEVKTVEMSWKTCTTESSATSVTREYTVNPSEALEFDGKNAPQAGYLILAKADDTIGTFCADTPKDANGKAYTDPDSALYGLVKVAYLKSETTQSNQSASTLTNNVTGGGTLNLGDYVNTTTPQLPSTGGMGTYIFTILGVALIGVAASLLIFKRRKDA